MRLENWRKVTLGVLATIFLGALGSGFWEKILSPLLEFTSEKISSWISSVSESYSSSIYSDAANLTGSISVDRLGGSLLFLFGLAWLVYSIQTKSENPVVASIVRGLKFYFEGWVGTILGGSFLIISTFSIVRVDAIDRVRNQSLKQMEIIRPYSGEIDYLLLRSEFLRVHDKKTYDEFQKKIGALAEKHKINNELFEQYINR